MSSDVELKAQIKDKANDTINRIYLYCEENKLPRNSVRIKYVGEYDFRIALLSSVRYEHKAAIAGIIKEFSEELDSFKTENGWCSDNQKFNIV